MVQIAYILLCHKDPDAIIDQARRLTAVGDCVVIHFDGRAAHAQFAKLHAALAETPRVIFAPRRIKCGWGAWSLVAATLVSVEAARDAFPQASHFYMLSGDCMPIKSAAMIHKRLAARDVDYIESFDFFESDWIKTGLREERLIYRHYFNERRHKRLFYAALSVQRHLGLRRRIPRDLTVMIGSQWWCLRRDTIEKILAFCRERRDVMRFFRTTWIPDETFFQTLVRHLVPEDDIESRTPTFLMFSDYGMPVTFYNDHYDMLLAQDFLFARKISPEAHDLKRRLGALYAAPQTRFNISNEGRTLYRFMTQKGRDGRRFAPRFWETEGRLNRDQEMLLVVCKKWHVAKRLVAQIAQRTGIPTIEYLFNEQTCALPDLGGIQSTLVKRHRHRRALLRMLFEYYQTRKLVICLDPSNFDLIEDLCGAGSVTRILELSCTFSQAYLTGHAQRVGLAGPETGATALAQLLPTLRADIAHESERLHDARFDHHACLCETDPIETQTNAIAGFLGVPSDTALTIAQTDRLFAD